MYNYLVRVIDCKPYLCDSLDSAYCKEVLSYDEKTDTFTRRNDCKISGAIVPRETIKSILKKFV